MDDRRLDDEFDFNAGDLSKQFEQLLRTRRLNELEEQARSRTPRSSSPASFHTRSSSHSHQQQPPQPQQAPPPVPQLTHRPSQHQPPTYTQYRSLPIVPCMPTDAASLKFRNLLITLSEYPTKYENPGLLDEALSHVPVDRIYAEAEEEHNVMKGIAASMGDGSKPEWGYQDCVIVSLLR
jgi:peptide-N4-(N-acetyl-beta-glucosaminyl)asparagine amidase